MIGTVPPATELASLERRLAAAVDGDVDFTEGARHLYATDASNYRQLPLGVVQPRHAADVLAALAVCHEARAPVLVRGAGTSLAGQACNRAVVLDLSRHLTRIVEVDPQARVARVEPGVVLDRLRDAAGAHGLTFGPDPATHAWCTVGGMIGNNSCGVHSVAHGRTEHNVEALTVATADGHALRVGPAGFTVEGTGGGRARAAEIADRVRDLVSRHEEEIRAGFPRIPRVVSGYNLRPLLPEEGGNLARALVGSEGTCAVVLEAVLRLVPRPPAQVLLVLGYPDAVAAADAVPELLASGCSGLEGFDALTVEMMRRKGLHRDRLGGLPPGGCWLLVELPGETAGAAAGAARSLMRRLGTRPPRPSAELLVDPSAQRSLWEVREAALAASVRVPGRPEGWEGWEDAAVAPERLGAYLRDLRDLLDAHHLHGPMYGHFGDACVHMRIDFDLRSREGIARYRRFVEEAADLVVSHGGSISGEHGDGQSRGELLARMFGPRLLAAFREYKSIWDPRGLMNPGKLIDALPLDADLRVAPPHALRRPPTVFRFPDDAGSLAQAAERCIGVGRCRRMGGGVMCPSYMATGEEAHSTRGRAHLLAEMLRSPDGLRGGWRSTEVREALDLCLSCKGCKSDCPVSVDMAAYKAEFLHHHYRGRPRPRAAYSMGLIHRWARLAALAPRAVNAVAAHPASGAAVKRLAGVAPQRSLPAFAPHTFAAWFRGRGARGPAGAPPCVVWPDTFTNHFVPEIGVAAVRALEAAGLRPVVPAAGACCGRPLYDSGMLGAARRELRRVLRVLRPAIDAGVPILVLEPSCLSVFRDELVNLFPDEPAARRLSSLAVSLGEVLAPRADRLRAAPLGRPALVQEHCHEHALTGFGAERALLDALGVEWTVAPPGCCGMAGSFGFERGRKHAVSLAVAERGLLPAVRAAGQGTLVVADGFSCREQVAQLAGRRAVHLAEVVAMALDAAPRG